MKLRIALLGVVAAACAIACATTRHASSVANASEEAFVLSKDAVVDAGPAADHEAEEDDAADAAPEPTALAYARGSYGQMVAADEAAGTRKPNPPNVFANGQRAVLSEHRAPSFWQVTLGEAKSADALLGAFVQTQRPSLAAKLAKYDAQIWGEGQGGRKIIVFNGMCRDGVRIGSDGSQNSDDWMVHEVDVNDGGDCFFRAYFDVKQGAFFRLEVNGDA